MATAPSLPKTMRAWVVTHRGNPNDVLKLKTDYPIPDKPTGRFRRAMLCQNTTTFIESATFAGRPHSFVNGLHLCLESKVFMLFDTTDALEYSVSLDPLTSASWLRSLNTQEQQELAQRMERKQMRVAATSRCVGMLLLQCGQSCRGIYERECQPQAIDNRRFLLCTDRQSDVLEHGPALLRRLHQRLLEVPGKRIVS